MEDLLSKLPSFSLGDKISTQLRFEIISGKIKPGDVLSENLIASKFEVSRSPAREALKELANEGLLRLERMGAIVNGLSKKDVEELYDVRFLIESFSMKVCANKTNHELFANLNFIIEKMKIAAAKKNFIELSIQDIAFHETIIKASEHKRVFHMWMGIRNLVVTALLLATTNRFKYEQEECDHLIKLHIDLVEQLKEGTPKKIEQMLQTHFDDTRKTVRENIHIKEGS